MSSARAGLNSGSMSSRTRGIRVGGDGLNNEIKFVTISSLGDEQDFGDLDSNRRQMSSISSQTRGVFGGGTPTNQNQLEYITIASTGNSVDFGNLSINRDAATGLSSPTRGLFACGLNPSPSPANVTSIDYITTATLGNIQDFGDMTVARHVPSGVSNATRGLVGGGLDPSVTDVIDYVTLASLGNGANFGNLSASKRSANGCASSIRGVWGGGVDASNRLNVVEYVEIAIQSNVVDFGDLTVARMEHTSFSNAHGGL